MAAYEHPHLYLPGEFELYVGPMKSGKTLAMVQRLQRFEYQNNVNFVAFKPALDNRFELNKIRTRFAGNNISIPAIPIDTENPEEILNRINGEMVIAIDEVQFFSERITTVIKSLMKDQRKHIIASALDTNFKGEPFGIIGELLAMSTKIEKCSGVCEVCGGKGTMTQRLINGEPAYYDDPIVLIEKSGKRESYQCRCLNCHEIKKGKRIEGFITKDNSIVKEK